MFEQTTKIEDDIEMNVCVCVYVCFGAQIHFDVVTCFFYVLGVLKVYTYCYCHNKNQ